MELKTAPDSERPDYDELQARLSEAEETLHAIQTGAVDAVVVSSPSGPQVYTLRGADHVYRTVLQEMSEGALCMTGQGLIIHANPAFCRLAGRTDSDIAGQSVYHFVAAEDRKTIENLIRSAPAKFETQILSPGKRVPVFLSVCTFQSDGVDVYCAVVTDLTGQKLQQQLLASQAALKESEQRRTLATEAAGIGAWDWDVRDQRMVADAKLYQLFGVEPFSTTVRENFDFVHPGDRDRVWNAQLQAIQHGAGLDEEFRVIWPDGSEHWLVAAGKVVHDDHGRPARLIGATWDITQRRQAEQFLRASESRYRTLVDTTGALTWSCPAEEMLSEPQTVHPDDLEGAIRCRQNAVARGEPFFHEHRVRREDREWRWMSTHATPIRDAEGVVVEWAGMSLDITERKQAQLDLAAAKSAFQIAASAAHELIYDWDAAAQRVNRLHGREQVTGYAETEDDGTRQWWVSRMHPDDVSPGIHVSVDSLPQSQTETHSEFRFRHKDGRWIWLSEHARLIRDAGGRVVRVIGSRIDITARKQAEDRLEQRNRQLDLLARTAQRLLFSTDPEQELENIFEEISRLIGMEMFFHYRPCEEPRVMKLNTAGGVSEKHRAQFAAMRFGELLCGRVAESRERLIVEDLQHSTQPGSDVLRAEGATSYCGFPLVANGELFGTLAFISARRTLLAEGAAQMIQAICDQIAMALERARFLKERSQQERRQAFLMRLSDALRPLAEPVAVHEAVTRITRDDFQADRCYYCEIIDGKAIIRRDASREDLRSTAGRYEVSRFPIFKAVLDGGRPLIVHDASTTRILDESLRRICLDLQIVSFINIPVIKEGKPAGILCIVQCTPRHWTEFEVETAREAAERAWSAAERARAQEARRESENRLRMAMEAAGAGSWQLTPATGEFTASRRALELHGLPPGTPLTHEQALNCIHPDDRGAVEAALRRTEAGEPFRLELRALQPDGSVRWLASHAERRQQNGARTVVGFVQDITERKLREQALSESEERYRATFENAAIGIAHVGLDGRWLRFNDAVCRITGYSREELSDRTFADITHPDDIRSDWQQVQRLLAGEIRTFTMDKRYIRNGGSPLWIRLTVSLLRDQAGAPANFISIIEDIDGRKRAEDALRESEHRLQIAKTAAGLGIHDFHVQTGELQWDERVRELWGIGPDVNVTYDLESCFWSGVHPDDHAQTRAAVDRALDPAGDGQFCAEYRVIHRENRQTKWVAATGRVVFDALTPVRLIGTVQDITARKQAEQLLLASSETFRHLVEQSPFGIYAVDADFRLVQVSAGAQKVFENVRPLIGRDFAEVLRTIWPEPFATDTIALFRRTLETGAPYHAPSTVERRGDIDAVESYDWKIERVTLPDGRFGVVCHFYDLSERQRLEAALRQSEAGFRAIANAAPALVWVCSTSGENMFLNDRWYEYTGQSPELSAGFGWAETLHPDDARDILPAWQHSCETGEPFEGEVRLRRHDGAYRWFMSRAIPARDEQGKISKWFGCSVDIHDAEEARQALREHAELLQTVLESTTDLVWVKDTEGRITLGNEATMALLGGGDKNKVLGRGARELIPDPRHAECVMANDTRIMQTGRAERVEEHFGATEDPMIFQTVKAPLRDATGHVIGVVGVSRNMTEDRRLALQLQTYAGRQAFLVRLNDALRELTDAGAIKTEAAHLLGEHLRAGRIGYADCEGEECTIGPHYTDGMTEIAGRYHLNDYGPILPDLLAGRPVVKPDIANDAGLSERQKATYASVPVAAMANVPLLKDGRLTAILFVHHSSPRSYPAEELELMHEVAERTWAAVERGRAEHALRAANRELEQFAYSASHDLREPLRNVVIASQMLARSYHNSPDEQAARYVRFITEGAQRMDLLVSDLLSYLQSTQADDEPLRLAAAKPVLERVLVNLNQAIAESGATVTHDALPSLPVRELHLQQLLQNLIANSIKYRKDREAPRIHVSAAPETGHWRFSVHDNGIGIAPEFHDKVFGLFKRLHAKTGKYSGTGVGLAICQKVVDRYGGRIWIKSEPGTGTVVYFTLPRAGGGNI